MTDHWVVPFRDHDEPVTDITEALNRWADNVLSDLHTDDAFIEFAEQVISTEVDAVRLREAMDNDEEFAALYYSILNELTANVLSRAITRNRHFRKDPPHRVTEDEVTAALSEMTEEGMIEWSGMSEDGDPMFRLNKPQEVVCRECGEVNTIEPNTVPSDYRCKKCTAWLYDDDMKED